MAWRICTLELQQQWILNTFYTQSWLRYKPCFSSERSSCKTMPNPNAIIGPVEENGVYRSRYNHELYNIFRDSGIEKLVSQRRLSWAGHVVRRDDQEPLKATFKGKFLSGRGKPGRRKISWKECVDSDWATLGVRNWEAVAKDRSRYRKILKEAKAQKWAVVPSKKKKNEY